MICAFAYKNYADTATITASSVAGNMSARRLQDPHVAEKWRGRSGGESLIFDLGGAFLVDTVALMGVTLTKAGQTQVRLSSGDPTGATGDRHNSGGVIGAVDPAYDYLVHLLPAPVNARYVRIDLSDSSVAAVEAGRAFIGPRTELSVPFSTGASFGYADLSQTSRSRGGQAYIDRNVGYRTLEATFDWLTTGERRGIIEELDRIVGQRQDLLFIANTKSDNLGRDSLWCLRDDMQPTVQPYSFEPFRKAFRLSERL
jgi:hypothetical protein